MMRPVTSDDADAVQGARGPVESAVHDDDVARLARRGGRRLPMLRQSEAAECGLACLAMIAGYYGHHVSLTHLRHRFSLSLKGVTVDHLMEMAQNLGFSSRPLRLELHDISQLVTPCVLHWDMDHYVVLREATRNKVWIHDPAAGERVLSHEEVGQHFTGVAVELTKGPTFQRQRMETPVSLRTLAGSIQGLSHSLMVIFGLALALELCTLLTPQFLQIVVDQVLADGDRDLLSFLGISYALLLVVTVIMSSARTWTVTWLSTQLSLNWTGNVFQHLMRLPQAYFIKRHLGDIVSRFGAIDAIQRTLTTQFVSVILDGMMAVLTLAVMLIYSPWLAALTLGAVAIYAIWRALYFRVYRESNLSQITVSAKQQSCLMEAVRGVQTLRLYNQDTAQTARYLNATTDTLNTSVAVQRLTILFSALNGLTTGAQRVAILWIGAWLALEGRFSAGMLMAFVAYSDQFATRAASLIDYLIQWRLVQLQCERLADIVLTPPEPNATGSYVGPLPAPSITFDRVSFRYADGEPWTIKDCSFEVMAGESVAIIGPSGCGKTTLIRLILGLLDPVQGVIRLGGIDIRQLGKRALRSMTGSVLQDDTLFAGTIADNIALFDSTATMARIEQVARMAEIHDDIAALPMGYHTHVGDMGSTLSGGQQQRLHVARALYRQPKLLVLDEATSHLDVEREARINGNLNSVHITRITVAHRLQTIESADRILACIAGAVVELRPNSEEKLRG